ncbi:hypothetical protein GCM10023083_75330 [Streptomyces phyllanthi]
MVYVRSDDSDVLAGAWRRLHGSVVGPALPSVGMLLGMEQLGPGQLVEVDLTVALPD